MLKKQLILANVLLIDDSLPDFVLTKALLSKDKIHLHLKHIRDGETALRYLDVKSGDIRCGYPAAERPDLILLDINMPSMSGTQVLKHLMSPSVDFDIPIIMLSGSDSQEDIDECDALGALGYISKPMSFQKLEDAIAPIATLKIQTQEEQRYLCRPQ